jgi:hypothetical protein
MIAHELFSVGTGRCVGGAGEVQQIKYGSPQVANRCGPHPGLILDGVDVVLA